MSGYIQTAIGVIVSIIFFLIGYRKTIGARRERVASANRSVYKALLRRLVLEEYVPKLRDINRLIDGKSQEFNVSTGDLHPGEDILSHVFSEVFDNDFIAPEKRIEIESRISTLLDQLAEKKQKMDEIRIYTSVSEKSKKLLLASLGLVASLVGALVPLLFISTEPNKTGWDTILSSTLLPALTVFLASLISVLAISFIKRAREVPNEAPSRTEAAIEGARLENQVAKILKSHQIKFEIEPALGSFRPDFVVKLGEKRIAIEVRSWRPPPPLSLVSRTLRVAQELISSRKIDEVAIIVRDRTKDLDLVNKFDKIYFIAIKDLDAWIKNQNNLDGRNSEK